MKKLLLLLLVVFSLQTQATHLMGGQMTSQNTGGLSYQITLTLYRDSLGVPMGTTQLITYTDSTGNFVVGSHYVNYDPTLTTNIGNGVERYIFTDTITFPFVGKFKAFTENCCRNAAILNLPSPSQNSLWLDVDIFADPSNSSPVFLNEPITVAQLNQPFSYNPLPFDVDGDSLSWQLDVPMDYLSGAILGTPILGYTLPPSDTIAPFSIDPLTGEIVFLPNVIGNFQVSVKAIEWRNGIQIGYIRRDMQLIVVPSNNIPTQVLPNYTVQKTLLNPIYIDPGQTFNLTVVTYNIDNGPVSVTLNGSVFFVPNNPAIIVSNDPYTSTGAYTTTTSTISWTPTQNEVRTKPYYLSFRVADYSTPYIFYNDYTFRVVVKNSVTGFNEVKPTSNKKLIQTVDMLGRDIDPNQEGFRINIYSDGTKEKVYIKK